MEAFKFFLSKFPLKKHLCKVNLSGNNHSCQWYSSYGNVDPLASVLSEQLTHNKDADNESQN